MISLADFLLARIAEERAAVWAWDGDGRARVATVWTGPEPGYSTVASDHGDGRWVADGREIADAQHPLVLFDPARVLADCEAREWIVKRYMSLRGLGSYKLEERQALGDVLRLFVQPYVDHPDFRAEWRL